eukprot:4984013-Amphidinium_carterae.1
MGFDQQLGMALFQPGKRHQGTSRVENKHYPHHSLPQHPPDLSALTSVPLNVCVSFESSIYSLCVCVFGWSASEQVRSERAPAVPQGRCKKGVQLFQRVLLPRCHMMAQRSSAFAIVVCPETFGPTARPRSSRVQRNGVS